MTKDRSSQIDVAFERTMAIVAAYGPPNTTPIAGEIDKLVKETHRLSEDELMDLLFTFSGVIWLLAGEVSVSQSLLAKVVDEPEQVRTPEQVVSSLALALAAARAERSG